jgi:hypothetical protein
MLILCVVGSVYMFTAIRQLNQDDFPVVYSTVAAAPVYTTSGGDMTHYFVDIKLDSGRKIVLRSCSYHSADHNKIAKLLPGDSISFQLENDVSQDALYVYSLVSNKYGAILLFENFESCYTKKWKIMLAACFVIASYIIVKALFFRGHDNTTA